LFHARICKTRSLAQATARRGRIRLNGEPVDKPHVQVKPGDVLTVPLGARVVALKILGLGDRRGPPSEACALYESLA
jgi:ribosome-associated heat shock protein Hsp15